eukprot:9187210-Lingulodinium_polyedra.AAC.1
MGKAPDVVTEVDETFLVSTYCSDREGRSFALSVSNNRVEAVQSNACDFRWWIPNVEFLGVPDSTLLASRMHA